LISVASLFKVDVHFSDKAEKPSAQDANTLTIHLTQTGTISKMGNTTSTAANGVLVEPGFAATLWLQGQGQVDIDREIQALKDIDRFPVDAAEKVQQDARYFIPMDQNMQLAAARSVPEFTLLR
jgi:hypothetical protein